MKKWILNHRKFITSFIIITTILCVSFISILNWYQNKNYDFLELLYYNSQVITSIFVISGVVIAIWQYYLSCLDSKRNMDIICVQKAIDLSEYYKDNILYYIAPINYILCNSGISDILKKIDKKQIKHFDNKELNLFLNQDDIDKLKQIQNSDVFFDIIIKANSIYNLGLNNDIIMRHQSKSEFDRSDNSDNNTSDVDSEIFSMFLGKLIIRLLNNMEYFALHFTHNVADESVVYKSLHQTYIDAVQMLYYNIASRNPLSPSKFFTNTIELYELWNNKAEKDEENFANGVRTLSDKGTVVENK